jgi:hypothetical protein
MPVLHTDITVSAPHCPHYVGPPASTLPDARQSALHSSLQCTLIRQYSHRLAYVSQNAVHSIKMLLTDKGEARRLPLLPILGESPGPARVQSARVEHEMRCLRPGTAANQNTQRACMRSPAPESALIKVVYMSLKVQSRFRNIEFRVQGQTLGRSLFWRPGPKL